MDSTNQQKNKEEQQLEWDQQFAIRSRTERLILYFSAVVLLASTYVAWNIKNENLLELLVSLAAAMAVAMLSRFLLGGAHIEGSFLGLKISGVTQGFAIFILAFIAFYFLIEPKPDTNERTIAKNHQNPEDSKDWIEIRRPDSSVWDVDYEKFCWYNALYVNARQKYFPTHYKNISKRGMNYDLLLFVPETEIGDTIVFNARFANMRGFLQEMNRLAKKEKYTDLASHVTIKVARVNNLPTFSFFHAKEENKDPYIVVYVDKIFNSLDDTPNRLLLLRDILYEERFKEVFNEYWSYSARNTFELEVNKLLDNNIPFSKWEDWESFKK